MPYNADSLNRLQIREQQELNRQRKIQEEADKRQHAEAIARSKAQYSHVRPQVFAQPEASDPTTAPNDGPNGDIQIHVYVRECDGESAQKFTYRERRSLTGKSEVTRMHPVPTATATSNREEVSSPSAGLASSSTLSLGRVPRYLQKRKAELQAEKQAIEDEAQRRRELAKIPPGCRLVPDQEKVETLKRLEARQEELEMQLSKIPIRFDTHSIKMRRRNIEEELAQIEVDKLKYSLNKTLYVPIN
ncbi:unnamed protein product [Phytomonas sp. EM1]|nr:unnamed protein product [Phytomonas sp. EM1]|eukprot:CCW64211.1 unnamed protein product [Phytomonas sp. isolate EM1]